MSVLYPQIRASWLPAMLGYALKGALIAGLYGVVHDEVTYSISSEYFTRLKFSQFHYADFGLPTRIFVGEIGFLATCGVGFMAGWFLARVAVPAFPPAEARRHCLRGFAIILASAFAASIVGVGLGLLGVPGADSPGWQEFALRLGVVDLPHFVRAAYIHNARYVGGLIGLILALGYLRRARRGAGQRPSSCA